MTDEALTAYTTAETTHALSRLTAAVEGLIEAGATGKDATDRQKWEVGDAINTLASLAGPALGRARRGSSPTVAIPDQYRKKFATLRERVLNGGPMPRSTLKDYARVAAIITASDSIRDKLTFSFARALTMVEDPAERLQWADEAIRSGYSVARLRDALNASRAKQGPATADNLPLQSAPSDKADAGRRGVYVCAQTGQQIIYVSVMVELLLDRDHPAAPKGLPGRNRHAILRFVNLPALAEWAVGRANDTP